VRAHELISINSFVITVIWPNFHVSVFGYVTVSFKSTFERLDHVITVHISTRTCLIFLYNGWKILKTTYSLWCFSLIKVSVMDMSTFVPAVD